MYRILWRAYALIGEQLWIIFHKISKKLISDNAKCVSYEGENKEK